MIYKLNPAKVSFRELLFEGIWFLPLACLVFVAFRIFRLKNQESVDIPPVDSLRDFVVLDEILSEEQRTAIWPVAEKLYDSGFRVSIPYRFVSPLQNCRYSGLMLVDEAGTTLAWLRFREASILRGRWKQPVLSFFSISDSAIKIMTNACHPEVLAPSEWLVKYYPNKDSEKVLALHHEACQQANGSPGRLKSFRFERDVVQGFDEILKSYADFQVRRGVFFEDDETRELSRLASEGMLCGTSEDSENDEIGEHDADTPLAEIVDEGPVGVNDPDRSVEPIALTTTTDLPDSKSPGLESDLVVREVRNIEKANSGWVSKLLLLVFSVVAFVALGAFAWDWKFILYLLPILFIHELGHYVAMKWFGYRNVKMFFLPLFGAAVSGQNFGAAGWKKSVVALAGPVPSIVLAVILGFVGWFNDWEWTRFPVGIALLLNVLNLLPLLPFDGGWVAHNTIFCRTPVLEIVFRVVTGILLLGLGLLSGAWLIAFIAVMLLLAIPTRWKVLKVGERLKPVLEATGEVESIPVNSIKRISSELQNSNIKIFQPKQLAQLVVQVHEDVVARPPSALASTMLILGHAATFFGGLFMGLILLFLNQSPFFRKPPEFKTTNLNIPIVNPILKTGDTQSPDGNQLVVMEYGDDFSAEAEFQARSSRSNVSVSRVKNVLFQSVRFPPGKNEEAISELGNLFDRRWLIKREEEARQRPELNPETTPPLKARVLESFPLLTVRFRTQDEARRVQEAIDSVTEIPGQFLPPWKKKLDPAAVELFNTLRLAHGIGESIPWQSDEGESRSQDQFRDNEEFDEQKYQAWQTEYQKKRKAWLEKELQSASGPSREIFEKALQAISEDAEDSGFGSIEETWSLLSPEIRQSMGEIGPDHPQYRHALNEIYHGFPMDDLEQPDDNSTEPSTKENADKVSRANTILLQANGAVDGAVLISDLVTWLKESGAEEITLSWSWIELPQ